MYIEKCLTVKMNNDRMSEVYKGNDKKCWWRIKDVIK